LEITSNVPGATGADCAIIFTTTEKPDMTGIFGVFCPLKRLWHIDRKWKLSTTTATDFSKISNKKIQKIQDWMNDYPRKILGWLSANELYEKIVN
jgi:hypothetical protein